MGRELGITEAQLTELDRYRTSSAFTAEERAVLDLAVAMTNDPVDVPTETNEELQRHFDEAQLVELVAAIAWENHRARFNRALGVDAVGFSAGATCALPTRRPATP